MEKQTNDWYDMFFAVLLGLLETFILFLALKWGWIWLMAMEVQADKVSNYTCTDCGAGSAIVLLGPLFSFVCCKVYYGLICFQLIKAKKHKNQIAYQSSLIAMILPVLSISGAVAWFLLSPKYFH